MTKHLIDSTKIAFIGAGNMAYAIILGMLNNNFNAKNIYVSSPSAPSKDNFNQLGINLSNNNLDVVNTCDLIILAVKPQLIEAVCADLKAVLASKKIISIAAGFNLDKLNLCTNSSQIIRVMPNTPSMFAQGVSGAFGAYLEPSFKAITNQILNSIGSVFWLENEDDINKITAVSGSGPAYFFKFMQYMSEQAMEFGFDEKTATELVLKTAQGAVTQATNGKDNFSQLAQKVCSKGGTTEAALNSFTQDNLDKTVKNAMQKCYLRAIEMGKN